jgi:hypothetical protein
MANYIKLQSIVLNSEVLIDLHAINIPDFIYFLLLSIINR